MTTCWSVLSLLQEPMATTFLFGHLPCTAYLFKDLLFLLDYSRYDSRDHLNSFCIFNKALSIHFEFKMLLEVLVGKM